MMGVCGMLGVGLALFCQRYLIPESRWSDRAAKISFWSLNLGLAWMVFATLFPLGVIQLYHSVSSGYFDARTLQFITGGANPCSNGSGFPEMCFSSSAAFSRFFTCAG